VHFRCHQIQVWVLASKSWREAWQPSPQKVDPGALSALLGDLLGVSRSRERDLLSVLLIYPRIFLRVFIAYHLLVGFLYVWLYSAICSCVLVVLVKLSVLAKWMTPSWGEEIISTKPRWNSVFVCIFLLFGLFMLLCVPPTYTIYISYAYGMI